jgi:hypothetical protein
MSSPRTAVMSSSSAADGSAPYPASLIRLVLATVLMIKNIDKNDQAATSR